MRATVRVVQLAVSVFESTQPKSISPNYIGIENQRNELLFFLLQFSSIKMNTPQQISSDPFRQY